MNTRLYINNELLDISKGIDTMIDYSVIDIRNINERNNASSYLITIEATEKVRRVFGFPDYITSSEAARLSKSYTAKLVNSNTLLVGKVKFAKVSIRGSKIMYEFYIIGDNGSWSSELADKQLKNLNLWQYSHDWTQTEQEASEIPNATKPYVYPLINSGKLGTFYVHDVALYTGNKPSFLIKGTVYPSDFSGQTLTLFNFGESSYNNEATNFTVENDYNGQGISRIIINDFDYVSFDEAPYGYIQIKGNNNRVRVTDRYPMIRVSDLMERVFRGIGYQVQSTFCDNILSKKYIAYEQHSGFEGQLRFQDNFKFRAGITEDKSVVNFPASTAEYKVAFDNTDYQVNFDTFNAFDTDDNSYQPKVAINQAFYFALRFTVSQSMQLQFFVVVEDLNGNKSYQNGVGLATYPTGTHNIETTTFTNIEIPTTSKVYVLVRYFNAQGTITFLKGNCRFENRINFTPKAEGDTIHLAQFLPNWSQLQFVSSIIKHFGLIVMTDVESRTIYMEDYDRFYANNTVIDWSDKIDANQDYEVFEVTEDKGKATVYKYKHDEKDTNLSYLKNTFNADYGSKEIANNSQFKTDETDLIELDYGPTYMDTIDSIGVSSVKLPKIVLDEFGSEHEVRILHYNGLKGLTSESWTQGSNTRYNVPHTFFFDDVTENYDSLHLDDNPNSIGVVTKHFEPFIEEQQQSKLLTAKLLLTPYDLSGFSSINELKRDFRSLYLLQLRNEKVLFRLNKITQYNPNVMETTECEFVKVLPKQFLPTYNVPVFEFSNIEILSNIEGNILTNLTVRVTCMNIGNTGGTATVYVTYSGTQFIASEQIAVGQSTVLEVVFNPNISVIIDTIGYVYFGKDFVKTAWFKYGFS